MLFETDDYTRLTRWLVPASTEAEIAIAAFDLNRSGMSMFCCDELHMLQVSECFLASVYAIAPSRRYRRAVSSRSAACP